MLTLRASGFSEFLLPLCIQHAHLPGNARVDNDAVNYDRLLCAVDMTYEDTSTPSGRASNPMSGLVNYAPVYQKMISTIGSPLTKPI